MNRPGPGGEASLGSRSVFVPYALAVFSAAFLVFLVQPMVGKRILPWYGGVPAVWTTCLAFYQTVLFLGYSYAHVVIRMLSPRLQVVVHGASVSTALLMLPILPVTPPELDGDSDPTTSVLSLLTSSVAIPFLVTASTGPLLQAWLTRAHPGRSPYALYAVSNLGSFLALFAYPFVIEPLLPLTSAERLWMFGFVATEILVLACAVPMLIERGPEEPSRVELPATSFDGGAFDALWWLGLSAAAVIVLMGVTNELCLDVASMPFLWMLPLAVYLLSFVVAFASERTYRRTPYAALAIASFLFTRSLALEDWIVEQVAAHCVLLFSVCMLLNGELHRSRPAPQGLTRYYLFISAGGALGGVFVGLAAPVVFSDYDELPLGLALTVALVALRGARERRSTAVADIRTRLTSILAVPILAFCGYLVWLDLRPDPQVLLATRSFFGVLSVYESRDGDELQRSLTNGTTIHGTQWLSQTGRRVPTSYYGRATGLGLVMSTLPRNEPLRVGVVGLGIGTIAAYGRPGDHIRFYEIDPVVARLAQPGGPFSYLEDSAAEVEVVLGDGRLSLESEQRRDGSQRFDLLVLDAFTSDSIALHLLTREAFERYFAALAPDGILAVHVTNRHFQLMDLVSRMAAELRAVSLHVESAPVPALKSGFADWVVVARDADQLEELRVRIEKRLRKLRLPVDSIVIRKGSDRTLDGLPVWTDDYSDLASVMVWN